MSSKRSDSNLTQSKCLILAGLYPKVSQPSGAPFIYERLKGLKNNHVNYDTLIISETYPKLIQNVFPYIKKRQMINRLYSGTWDNIPVINYIYSHTIISTIFSIFTPTIILHNITSIIKKTLRNDAYSMIHAHWVYPHGYCAVNTAKKHNIPCIVTAHGSDIHTIPQRNRTIKKYTLKTLNSADKVIFVSHALLDSAKDLGYSGENAVVIPNGIDMKYFYPMEKEEALKRTGWKQTKRHVVGFVGNLIPVKRADKFVEIFSEIQKQVLDVEFILVGTGDLADNIHSGASDAGLTVTFAGRVPHEDVCCWINLFDVMILPSRNESWGCVIQEAYACGVPVVGAAIGGIPENLGGVCPSVAEGEEFEKRFADAVCDVLVGEFSVDKGMLVARAGEHTWDKCVEREVDVYHEVSRCRVSK